MYRHILISTDGSEIAQKGVDHGLALAAGLGAKVTILTVTERFPFGGIVPGAGWVPSDAEIAGFDKTQKENAQKILTAAREAADKAGVTAETVHVADGWPSEAILDTAKAQGCDLVVMSSHGRRGLNRLLLGSQTSEVLSYGTLPVLVVR